jgi:hypothetical protein
MFHVPSEQHVWLCLYYSYEVVKRVLLALATSRVAAVENSGGDTSQQRYGSHRRMFKIKIRRTQNDASCMYLMYVQLVHPYITECTYYKTGTRTTTYGAGMTFIYKHRHI